MDRIGRIASIAKRLPGGGAGLGRTSAIRSSSSVSWSTTGARCSARLWARQRRAYVGELIDIRNRWAHFKADKPFTASDTERALDTMARLATAISAPELRQSSGPCAARSCERPGRWPGSRNSAARPRCPLRALRRPGLRPWRDVIEPHPDVAGGRYAQAEFAADLGQVARGEAGEEYGDPRRFFERTFLTSRTDRPLGDRAAAPCRPTRG